ncbi:MAG: hypothetical protein QM679_00405 [Patulibacter sp.]
MDTAFDILQAIGLGLAFGLRPVFAPLLVALLGALHVGIDLRDTDLAELGTTWFVIVVAVIAAAWLSFELTRGGLHPVAHLAFAVLFAAAYGAGGYDQHHGAWWPGAVAGLAGALLAFAALSPLVAGARQRLAGERDSSVILLGVLELAAVVTAFLSLIFPPLALVALVAVLVLLVRGRGTRDGRYAGLRTLTK